MINPNSTDIAGLPLSWRAQGKGKILLCLHAIGHDARDFDDLGRWIGDAYQIVAVDAPGHGATPSDGHPPRPDRYSRQIEALIEAEGWGQVILLGNSFGGATALDLASRRPDLVESLILCNSGGLAPIGHIDRFAIKQMVRFFEAGRQQKGWFGSAYALYYRLVLPGRPARQRRAEIVANGYRSAPLLKQAWQGFAEPEADQRARATKLTMPVWVAWAMQDRIIAWSKSQHAISTIPHRRVSHFHGGHAAFLEDPEAFAKEFNQFAQSYMR